MGRSPGYGYMPFEYVLNYANDLVACTRPNTITAAHIGTQAVGAHADRLDVFVTDSNGVVHGAAWQQNVLADKWRDWWPILDEAFAGHGRSGPPVAAVARDSTSWISSGPAGRQDIHRGLGSNVTNGQWRGWWNILTGRFRPEARSPPCRAPPTSWTS